LHRNKVLKIAIPLLSIILLNSIYLGFSAFSGRQIQATEDVKWPPWDFPRLQTLYMVEAWPAATARTMALECKIDVFLGATTTSDVEALRAAGWAVTHSGGGLHYCYFGVNCRDRQPVWTKEWRPYHGRTPGFELYPLNISSFRLALQYIIGCERTAWCWDIMAYIVVRNDFPMPPGFGEWRNPYIKEYPEDWAKAVDILKENGFWYDMGADGILNSKLTPSTDDIWYMPNGQVLVGGRTSAHPGSDRAADGAGTYFGIFVMSPPATVSIEFVRRHCKKWNKFFMGEELEGIAEPQALFHHEMMASSGDMIYIVWYNRNHDIFYLCGSFTVRAPDYLHDTFCSSQDIEGGDNDPGMVNHGFDLLAYTIKTFQMKDYELLEYNVGDEEAKLIPASTHYIVPQPEDVLDIKIERCHKTGVYYQYLIEGINYTLTGSDLHILNDIILYKGDALEVNYDTCTYLRVPSYEEYRDIVWLADWKIFYLCPQLGNYGRDYYDLFKPGHAGWVQGIGYGAGAYQLPWTFGNIHEASWVPIGGSMQWQNEGDVPSLNPIVATWVYEMEILNRIYEGMITRDPLTGAEMPWIALSIEEETVTLPGNVLGQNITITIRDDVTWQDGTPVTADDIIWDINYIATSRWPEYVILWSFFVSAEKLGDYVVRLTINTTGHWKTLDYLGSLLVFPQVIWQGDRLDTYAEAIAFKPWAYSYEAWVGSPPPNGLNGLTALMGTGPFILNLTAGGWDESDFAVMSKYPGYWRRNANPGDITLDMVVDEDDLWFFCARFIDYYTTGWVHYLCDYYPNETIDEDDLWFFCAAFIDYWTYGLHGKP